MTQKILTKTKRHTTPQGVDGGGVDTLEFNVPSGFYFLRCELIYKGRAYPGAQVVKRPAIGDSGKNKQVEVHWYFDGTVPSNNISGHKDIAHPHIEYTLKFITQSDISSVAKEHRALLVINNIAQGGLDELSFIYQTLDNLFPAAALVILKNDYQIIEKLTGSEATYDAFKNSLQSLGKKDDIKAIDVFLCLHGAKKKLWFGPKVVPTSTISKDLSDMKLENKFRWLYSLACHGSTHIQDFLDGGFRVAEGAAAVNTNGAYDFPAQIKKWEAGGSVEQAVNAGNNPSMMWLHDSTIDFTLKKLGKNFNVNSKKIIRGIKSTTISSVAS